MICQLSFVAALVLLLSQLEQQIDNEKTSKAISTESSSIMSTSYALLSSVINAEVEKQRSEYHLRYFQVLSKEQLQHIENLEKLKIRAADQPSLERLISAAIALEKSIQVSKQKLVSGEESSDLFANLRLTRDCQKQINAALDSFRVVLVAEAGACTKSNEKIAELRKNVEYVIAFGICLNFLISAFLIFAFQKSISNRISILVENTRRLANSQTLAQPLLGSDDFVIIDHSFHQMADALDKAKQAERETQRLKKAFVAMVSHDLRTPLGSIQNCLELLSLGIYESKSGKGPDAIASALGESTRLIKLVNDLLDLEGLDSAKFNIIKRDIQIKSTIEHALKSIDTLAKSKEIAVAIESIDESIHADPDRIVQVLVNLLSNGIKFSPQGSTISVRTKHSGESIEFSITDQGRGIPEEKLQEIFQPFVQIETEDARRGFGTGLGLTICKQIVEAHGGRIYVTSKIDEGSCFRFTIPFGNATTGDGAQL